MELSPEFADLIAAHNRKGAADKINYSTHAVFNVDAAVKVLDVLEPGKLDAFVAAYVDSARLYATEVAKLELLGYEILVAPKSEAIMLRIFTGREMNPEETFVNQALEKLTPDEVKDYDTLHSRLREIMPAEAFDRFRAIMSKSGVTRELWNGPKKNKPYTGPMTGGGIIKS